MLLRPRRDRLGLKTFAGFNLHSKALCAACVGDRLRKAELWGTKSWARDRNQQTRRQGVSWLLKTLANQKLTFGPLWPEHFGCVRQRRQEEANDPHTRYAVGDQFTKSNLANLNCVCVWPGQGQQAEQKSCRMFVLTNRKVARFRGPINCGPQLPEDDRRQNGATLKCALKRIANFLLCCLALCHKIITQRWTRGCATLFGVCLGTL